MTIEIVSASAGSGKTYHLASLLEAALRDGTARPDAVLVTTFTRAAAAELSERVRRRLLGSGLHDAARRLSAARIGTVNSICARLLSDFAFELGLSPELETVDEVTAATMLSRALSSVVGASEARALTALKRRLTGFEWEGAVRRVMQLARINAIEPTRLVTCAQRSIVAFRELLGAPRDEATFDRELLAALDAFLDRAASGVALDASTSKAVALVRRAGMRLRRGSGLSWHGYQVLSAFPVASWLQQEADHLRSLASFHLAHPRLHDDLREATELVFTIAARGLEHYQRYKNERGVIDFEDQESLALRLLGIERVRLSLAEELDLVLVDEFQDTTPIQLALFLRLAELADRSVWVGDQKQAIYGFRGSDPALMDRAVSRILAGREPRTLTRSWRSRPLLVEVTSALFAEAFSHHGVAPGRVTLTAANDEPIGGLGPVIEYWELNAKRWEKQAAALASTLDQLLDDPSVRVRDPRDGTVRPIEPGDVAVLCQTNKMCALVAEALAARGYRVDYERAGLLRSAEGRLLRAALQLWIDPRDSLARATIERILEHPLDADAWLARAGDERLTSSTPHRWLETLIERRERCASVGLSEVLAQLCDALDLDRWAHALPDGATRLANIDAFLGAAQRYVDGASSRGGSATIWGLLDELERASLEGRDLQGHADGEGGISVLTWHKSKGLEWPICVLFQLEREGFVDPFDVQIIGDVAAVDLSDPLRGLEIRYWPRLYPKSVKDTPLSARVEGDAFHGALSEREERQRLRLLYVGWTRARDRLVLCGSANLFWEGMIPLLRGPKQERLLSRPAQGRAIWGGVELEVPIRRFSPTAIRETTRDGLERLVRPLRRHRPPLLCNPSALELDGQTERVHTLGEPLAARGRIDPDRFGEMVHAFLAARLLHDESRARVIAERSLRGFKMEGDVDPESLLEMARRLVDFIELEHPGASSWVEVPLRALQPNGSVLSGTADLVLDLGGRLVLIDHKTFIGRREAALANARSYCGQLQAYAAALTGALGKPVAPWYIHMPLSGLMVQVAPLAREPVQQSLGL